MDNQLLDSDANDDGRITFSSELAAAPFTNSLNDQRSRVWRPTGFFNITSTTNTIYWDDGAPQSATITATTYATPALLAAAIQAAMVAITANITVIHTSATAFRFRFATSGADFDLKPGTTTNAMWDVIGFTGVLNLTVTSGTPVNADETRNHTEEFVQIDMIGPQEIEAISAVPPIDGLFGLSNSAMVKIQANNVDLFTSPPLDITITFDDRGAYKLLSSSDTGFSAYRYWKWSYVDRTNPAGPENVDIGKLDFATFTTFTSSNIARGYTQAQVDPSTAQESERGNRFFDTRTKYETFRSMAVQNLSAADRNALEQIYNDFGKTRPLMVSFDPELVFSTVQSELTRYVFFDTDVSKDHQFLDIFNIGLTFREAV